MIAIKTTRFDFLLERIKGTGSKKIISTMKSGFRDFLTQEIRFPYLNENYGQS
jgi:hypothetical protein